MKVSLQSLGKDYTVEFWVWNGLQQTLRPVAGWLFSRAEDGDADAGSENLGISGKSPGAPEGRVVFSSSPDLQKALYGSTALPAKKWHHVVMARAGDTVKVYVNGKVEISGTTRVDSPHKMKTAFFGGRCGGGGAGLEGRIDEIAVYNFPLSETQLRAHFEAAAAPHPKNDLQPSAGGQGY